MIFGDLFSHACSPVILHHQSETEIPSKQIVFSISGDCFALKCAKISCGVAFFFAHVSQKPQCPPWKSQSPQDALWTGGCGNCRPAAPLSGYEDKT